MGDVGGTVRYNAETGVAHVLTGRGWQRLAGEEADAAVEAARMGVSGAAMTALSDALTLGIADSPVMQQLRQQNPGVMAAGIGAELALGGTTLMGRKAAAPIARAGMRDVTPDAASTVAQRVEQRLLQNAASTGGDSVSAAVADLGQGGAGWRNPLDRLFTEFAGDPQSLSTTQRRLIDSGLIQKHNFQLLPGQARGVNILDESARSDAIIATAYDDVYETNRSLVNRSTRRAIGLPDGDEFGFDELGEAVELFSERFDAVPGQIGTVTLPDDAAQFIAEELADAPNIRRILRKNTGVENVEAGQELSGQTIMSLRESFLKKSRRLWAAGEDDLAESVDIAIESLDDIIQTSMSAADAATYAQTREQWRVFRYLERPGSMTDAGDLNPKSLGKAGKLRKEFKGAFGRSDTVDRGKVRNAETADWLEVMRLASAFSTNIPDSGTASRLTIQNIISNPATLPLRLMVRARLKRMADSTNMDIHGE